MNELERMLRADLHDVAGTVDIPVRLDTVAAVQENAGDILAEAKELNEQRTAQDEVVEDAAEEAGAKA